ncbi:ATP-binding protein [Polaribacter sargassicola]|uniref:ATP-binding protein n=1 Tax=Polaribacter sargassicola TaxID=2836891 RepID=UPI001F4489ED|nr:ATP-binding protein [Polaribacter sp. DS7-9]MCG1036499.1 hypothetical protein [Polaribacter sp. DS7-9]
MEKKLLKEKQLQKELWKISDTIFWSLNSVILFTIILDLIILSKNWLDFVLLKLFLFIFFYAAYNFFKKTRGATPYLLIHLILFSFNFLTLISISHSGTVNTIVYTTVLIVSFVTFNLIIVWPIINSFIQYLLVVVVFSLLVLLEIINDPYQVLKEGGYLFLSLGFISFFLPKIKENVLIERIEVALKADEKINFLQKELSETQTKYNLLEQKVLKKENESKFMFQQISNDLNKVNDVISTVNDNTSQERKKKIEDISDLIDNLRNQSSVYFKPVNLNTNNKNYATDTVDVKKVYLDVFKSFTNKIAEKNITGTDKLIDTNPLIIGNERMFKTIIYNILNFMVIFSKENDEIIVTIDNLKNDTIFSVTNKTTGINSTEIESYFRDLEFVNYDYQKHSDSVKIGLRISKQLTQKMNGYFSYVSSESMGFELKIQFETYK